MFLIFGVQFLSILTLSGEPIILCLVGMETTLVVFFEKVIVHMPENSEMAKIWPFVAKIWPFLAKIDSFKGFWPLTSKRRYESS